MQEPPLRFQGVHLPYAPSGPGGWMSLVESVGTTRRTIRFAFFGARMESYCACRLIPSRAAEPNSLSSSRRSREPGICEAYVMGDRACSMRLPPKCASTSCRVRRTARARWSRHSLVTAASCSRAAASASSRAALAASSRATVTLCANRSRHSRSAAPTCRAISASLRARSLSSSMRSRCVRTSHSSCALPFSSSALTSERRSASTSFCSAATVGAELSERALRIIAMLTSLRSAACSSCCSICRWTRSRREALLSSSSRAARMALSATSMLWLRASSSASLLSTAAFSCSSRSRM
mmetsp:Transcript_1608/g.4062  ORF Transcript_1608/g.4062 Transcript_1608/m.4062 type:complete len:296 (-) Transcript_1608:358-1245(-)